jgi:hypothetical protein
MQIGNVFMNDCSSLVASDGNNKVKDLGTDHLNFEGGGGCGRIKKWYRASSSNLKKISCKSKRTEKNIEQTFEW